MVVALIAAMVRNHYLLPFWDEWNAVGFVRRYYEGGLTLSDFWAQHSEHRLFLPRIFFLADYALFGGTKTFLYLSIFAVQTIHWLLFAWIVRSYGRVERAGVLTFAAIAAILFFSGAQWENFAWGFQVQFVGVFLLATASFLALGGAARMSGEGNARAMWVRVAGAIVFAAAATGTMANGLLVWPLLIVLGAFLRLPWRAIASIAAVGAVLAWLYFSGYQSTSAHADPIASLLSLGPVLAFTAAYLGKPVQNFGLLPCLAMGSLGMLLAAGVVVHQVTSREAPRELRATLAAILLFLAGTAFLTALGRINFGVHAALDFSRYATPALIFWTALLVYALVVWRRDRHKPVLAAGVLAAAVLLAVNTVATHRSSLDALAQIHFRAGQAALALELDIPDPDSLKAVFPDPPVVLEDAKFLRAHALSIFKSPAPPLVGLSVTQDFAPRAADACLGAFDTIAPVAGLDAARVVGWAWDKDRKRPFDTVVIAGADEKILGVAKGGDGRGDVPAALPEVTSGRAGWRGLMHLGEGPLAAYGVDLGARTACKIVGSPALAP